MKTGNVNFTVVNEAFQPAVKPIGILFFGGICKRGPVNDPSLLITTPKQFREVFGNSDIADTFPILAGRALAKGAALRVNRITDGAEAHAYSPVIGSGALSGAAAEVTTITCIARTGTNFDGKYFLISAGNLGTNYYVWFSGTDPAIPGCTGVKCEITADKTAGQVATALHATLEAIAGTPFSATISTNDVIVTAAASGPAENATAGTSGFTVVVSTPGASGTYAVPMFQFQSKYPGADYNNTRIVISDASNGNADYFNMAISLINDPLVVETYYNCFITGNPNVASSSYFSLVEQNSNLITPIYSDLSAQNGQLRPVNGTFSLTQGSDGSTIDAADFIGSSAAKTGLYAWDDFDDGYAAAYPAVEADTYVGLVSAGKVYAEARKDLIYYQHLSNSNISAAQYIAEKASSAPYNSEYLVLVGGGLYISHPVTGTKIEISELADVLGNMAAIMNNGNPWSSFFGLNRGVLSDTLGVVNNFGSPARLSDLDSLASNQINMVITRNGVTMLWDDYTTQVTPSPENFACNMNLILFMKKGLKMLLEYFLGEPTDFQLLKTMYLECRPFMDSLVTGRGFSSYQWNGDQFATAFAELAVNNPSDMQLGKVKIEIKVITIAPLKEISVKIVLTRAGVTFE